MAYISSKGLVDDGSTNLSVAGTISVGGTIVNQAQAFSGTSGASSVFGAPGFYYLSASGTLATGGSFTGSVPSPASFPGSTLMITEVSGAYSWMLTGTSYRPGIAALFVALSGSTRSATNLAAGSSIQLPASASVMLTSDGFRWLVVAGTSGSITFAGPSL